MANGRAERVWRADRGEQVHMPCVCIQADQARGGLGRSMGRHIFQYLGATAT